MKKILLFAILVVGFIAVYTFLYAQEKRDMVETNFIQLPDPVVAGEMSLEEAILKRRSERSFAAEELTLKQISQLLWSAQGITAHKQGIGFRAAPSAGALYPMEIYTLTKDGLFHYLPQGHKLKIVQNADLRGRLANAALGQSFIQQAPFTIVICAVYERITSKYGNRGIQYVHMEAGHIAQNVHLQAVTLGLGSVPIGAFNDDKVKKVLSLPSKHEPVYIVTVGYTR